MFRIQRNLEEITILTELAYKKALVIKQNLTKFMHKSNKCIKRTTSKVI